MLDITKIRNDVVNRGLAGSYCEEYSYTYDTRTLKFEKSGYLIAANPDIKIYSNNNLTNNLYHVFINNDLKSCNIKYSVDLNLSGETMHLSESDITINDFNQIKATPFKEYIAKNNKIINPNDFNKLPCRGLYFNIFTKSSSRSSKENNTYTDYIYNLEFTVGVDQTCYIYIVQSPDTTLPTILVCKNRIGEFDLNDINNYIFRGNTNETPNMYNSYFHPHEYSIIKSTIYENTVYSSPDGFLNKLRFREEIINDESGNKLYYSESDKLLAINNNNNNVSIKLDNYNIGEYEVGTVDYKNINLVKYVENIDAFNSMHKIKEKISVNELVKRYPNIKNILPVILTQYKDDDILSCIEIDDPFNIFTFEYYDVIFTNIVIRIIDDETIEILYILNNNEKVYYVVYRNGYKLNIVVSTNENDNNVYYSTSTINRTINYTGNTGIIAYKDNFWINVNKSNTIVNTNLPLSGEFTKYNIFGIPEKF